jgi:TolB-like protein
MVFGAVLLVCAGLFAQNVSLEQAVQTSAQAIETRLPKGAKTAVLTFTSTKQAFSDYIIEELATALSLNKNLQLIDRQHMDAIRKEFNVQFSGDVSDEEVKSIGKQLGAQYVVTGAIVDIGNAYRFRVAAINVESAVREGSPPLNININDPQVVFLLTGQRVTQTSNIEKTYKVGDRGPAGGFVFYDKGVFSNGWRYLEAAPSETEFRAQWGAYNGSTYKMVYGTGTAVGSGKRNTEIIVNQLKQWGENGRASQLCASLNFDGFTDWFLPSSDELNLMYQNLKQRGLGDFSNGWYYSSSHTTGLNYVHLLNFNNGAIGDYRASDRNNKNMYHYVRAVRAF